MAQPCCALVVVSVWGMVGKAKSFLCPVRWGHRCVGIVNRVHLYCGDLKKALGALALAVSVVLGVTGIRDNHLGGVALRAVHGQYQK